MDDETLTPATLPPDLSDLPELEQLGKSPPTRFSGSWAVLAVCQRCQEDFTGTEIYIRGMKVSPARFCQPCVAAINKEADDKETEARQLLADYRLRTWFEKAGFPARYAGKGFDGFDMNRYPRAYKSALDWLDLWGATPVTDIPSLVLQGGNGVGKTRLAVAIGEEICRRLVPSRHVEPVLFTTGPALAVRVGASYETGGETEAALFKELTSCLLLIIDDAADPNKEKPSDATRRRYFNLVNGRYEAMLPILWTTKLRVNEQEDVWKSMITADAYSRLMEMTGGRVVDMGSADRRLSPAPKRERERNAVDLLRLDNPGASGWTKDCHPAQLGL